MHDEEQKKSEKYNFVVTVGFLFPFELMTIDFVVHSLDQKSFSIFRFVVRLKV